MFGLIKLTELSKELGVPESTVRTWKRRGDIPPSCFKPIGGTIYVKINKMQEWIDNNS